MHKVIVSSEQGYEVLHLGNFLSAAPSQSSLHSSVCPSRKQCQRGSVWWGRRGCRGLGMKVHRLKTNRVTVSENLSCLC